MTKTRTCPVCKEEHQGPGVRYCSNACRWLAAEFRRHQRALASLEKIRRRERGEDATFSHRATLVIERRVLLASLAVIAKELGASDREQVALDTLMSAPELLAAPPPPTDGKETK
jgi:hypothetical protein